MAIVNIRWEVTQVALDALVAAGFDAWLVEMLSGPTWVEISRGTTRPPITPNGLLYVYTDAAGPVDGVTGDANGSYRATPYRTSDGATDTPVSASKARRGYLVPQDIWDEGYVNPPWTPLKLWRGIDRATTMIDSICRQWFEPRYAQFVFNGTDHDQLWLDLPICALLALLQDDTVVDLGDVEVYNRHLTRGQLNPDDRMNPKVSYALDYPPGYRGRRRRIYADSALFGAGRKNVLLKGVFGYTELGPGNYAGETVTDSQLPLSYGQTPAEIKRAALLLALTFMLPAADQQDAFLQNRVTQIKTRDQSISFSDMSSSNSGDASFGLTGNIEVDNILMRYSGPLRMGAAGR